MSSSIQGQGPGARSYGPVQAVRPWTGARTGPSGKARHGGGRDRRLALEKDSDLRGHGVEVTDCAGGSSDRVHGRHRHAKHNCHLRKAGQEVARHHFSTGLPAMAASGGRSRDHGMGGYGEAIFGVILEFHPDGDLRQRAARKPAGHRGNEARSGSHE